MASNYVEMDNMKKENIPNYSSDDNEDLIPVDDSYASYAEPQPRRPRPNSNVARKQLLEIPENTSPKKAAVCLTVVAVIVIISLAATGGFAAGSYYTVKTHGTTVAVAQTTLLANTSVDPCTESVYDFACGGYAYNHDKYSNLGDFQFFIDSKVEDMLLNDNKFKNTKAGNFFADCLDYTDTIKNHSNYEYFDVDALWMWQRGFDAFDLVFGRTIDPRNMHSSKVYVANTTYFTKYHSNMLPKVLNYNANNCEASIVAFARQVVDNYMITSVLYYGDDKQELCAFADDWLARKSDKNATKEERMTITNLFDSNLKCLRTTSNLWPGVIGDVMSVLNVNKADESFILKLCSEIKLFFNEMLVESGFSNVAAKITSVECSASTFKEHFVYDIFFFA